MIFDVSAEARLVKLWWDFANHILIYFPSNDGYRMPRKGSTEMRNAESSGRSMVHEFD